MNHAALLVVDVQNGMFPASDPVYSGEDLLKRIKGLIEQARSCQAHVIYVQHNEGPGEQLETGTADWEIHPSIAPESEDPVIQKFVPDSFHETELQELLKQKDIQRLVIAGIQTDLCVEATSKRASELGYDVTIARDAHSTWGQNGQSAAEIIEEYNHRFQTFAKLEDASRIRF
ncbi:cysteine hydrolase family protein [Paenibacillus sp. SAF-054]|uniref:cysteine hydrolase family protein n=1 Tax=unclassified Paenibacillus TaxID=185978 RepID=UPI003F7F34EA